MGTVAKKIMMGSGAVALPSDSEFNRTSFLSHFDGTNNGVNNQFTDGSASNHTITANGDVTQGSFGPFARPDGEWGVSFDNSGDRLSIPSSSDFGFGTGDYTISFMVFLTAINDYDTILAVGSGNNGLGLFIEDGVNLAFGRAGTAIDVTFSNVFTGLGRWNSIVFKRASGVVTVYVNGSSVGTNNTSSSQFDYQAAAISIGTEINGSTNPFGGIISNFRIVKGTALTPSSGFPTSKLTAVTNTVLLTCQSNRFIDNSVSGHAITPSGNAAVSAFGPFLTSAVYDPAVNGASGYFDGDGDYLSLSPQSDFAFGTGDFSVSLWVYYHNLGTFDYLIEGRNSGQTTDTWSLSINFTNGAANKLMFASIPSGGSATAVLTSDTDFVTGQWYYITVSRSGTTSRMHFNGTQVAINTSDSTNYSTSPNTSYIGTRYSLQYYFDGIMSDVRVVKGSALSSYTPPTVPLTAVTNTKLLLNMADGQAIDSTAQNNLTLAGNANTSTDQAKFGNTSLHLDGTGDFAEVASRIGAWGTGNFTVEGWYYLTAQAQYDNLFDFRTSGNTDHLDVYFDDDPLRLHVFFGGTDRINANAATPTNEWVHIAVVRNGSTTTLYQNGTSLGTSTTVTTFTEGALRIGNRYSGDYYMQGYVDDFRVSHMARYTSNFTAPAEPFADKGQ